MFHRAVVVALALVTAACSTSSKTLDGASGGVRDFTGARTRVVWVQGDGSDPYAAGDSLVLMGLDTDDRHGERVILGERNSYMKPLVTPRGDRIVFSRRPTRPQGAEVFLVNWDGSGLKSLGKGFGFAVWQHPGDGREWVYVGTDNKPNEFDFATVSRFPIDAPSAREVVWNKTPVSADTFQVSADGRYAGGLFPWPKAGIAELPNGNLRTVGDGCWTAMATVRGPMMWYFDGAHRNLTVVDMRSDKRWSININSVPGFNNPEVYHPRWTNHPRFIAMSGPYNLGGANQVRSGGAQSEVYLGRFAPDYSAVEAWMRVTHNGGGDSYPDVWIDRQQSPHDVTPRGTLGPPQSSAAATGRGGAPANRGRVVVEARLTKAGVVPTPQSIAPYKNALVVNVYEVVKAIDGGYSGKTILVAHWAIRDRRVLPQARKTPGSIHTLTLERYDAHPELEGERLISGDGTPNLPLYVEAGASK